MEKRKTHRLSRLVSAKFYDEISERVSRSLLCVGTPEDELLECTEAIDCYMTCGVLAEEPASLTFRVVFATVKPVIDSAIARSARARRRRKPILTAADNKRPSKPLNNNMQEIVFATNNKHKLEEIRRIVGDGFNILSLNDIACHEDIPETADTLAGNALQKARYVKEHYGYDCFADDTGLMVDALGGAPGVYSARYAGPGHDSAANMALLLRNMEGESDRSARFVTVIALILNGQEHLFEGKVEGEILRSPQGSAGFGYDPVFKPLESAVSFACMSADDKNAISHRGRATARLLDFLSNQ